MNYACIYKGKLYRSDFGKISSLLYDYKERDIESLIKVAKPNSEISKNIIFEKNNDIISLVEKTAIFTDDLTIKEVDEVLLSINYKSKDLNQEDLTKFKSYIENEEYSKYKGSYELYQSYFYQGHFNKKVYDSTTAIIDFLMFYIEKQSPYLYKILDKTMVLGINKNYKYKDEVFIKFLLLNMINAAFFASDGFEKILKSNPNIIYSAIGSNELSITNEGKINRVIQLPKYVIDFTEKNKFQNLVPLLQRLKIDGNSYRVIIDFLDSSSGFISSNKRSEAFEEFLENLVAVLELKEYNIIDLLNFLIKESYYRPCNKKQKFYYRSKDKYTEGSMSFPIEEIKLLKDYLKMAKINGLTAKKYPEILLDHNVMMKNLESLDEIKDEEFKEAIDKYKDMTEKYSSHKYTMLYPETVKDMIEEGNELHHCVAGYSFALLKGNSKIFFLRTKEEPNKPFITVEVNKENKLNHIRGAYNEIPEIGIINSVNNWLKKCS